MTTSPSDSRESFWNKTIIEIPDTYVIGGICAVVIGVLLMVVLG